MVAASVKSHADEAWSQRDVEYYRRQVWLREPATFLATRGIKHSSVERFELGYVHMPLPGHSKYEGCLVIPYQDGRYRVRGVRFRILPERTKEDLKAKYLSLPGAKTHLFAVRAVDKPVVFICEGEIDTITMWQLGFPAVGIPGATSWKKEWRWLFRDCQEVCLCLDMDEAGIRATQNIYRDLYGLGPVITRIELPEGLDVNDVYRLQGEEHLRWLVARRSDG